MEFVAQHLFNVNKPGDTVHVSAHTAYTIHRTTLNRNRAMMNLCIDHKERENVYMCKRESKIEQNLHINESLMRSSIIHSSLMVHDITILINFEMGKSKNPNTEKLLHLKYTINYQNSSNVMAFTFKWMKEKNRNVCN